MIFSELFQLENHQPEITVNIMEFPYGLVEVTQRNSTPANLSQPHLQAETPNTIMKLPALFQDHTKGTRADNHLMLEKEGMKVQMFSFEQQVFDK